MDGGEDLSIKNTINSIVSRQRRLNLNLSELIEMVQEDPTIWEFSESLKEEVDKKMLITIRWLRKELPRKARPSKKQGSLRLTKSTPCCNWKTRPSKKCYTR